MRHQLADAAALLQTDDPEKLGKALQLLQETVYSFSMKVCGHREDAEDTMQEVLMRALPHLKRISEPRALAVWLYTVTRNRCWRMRRKPAGAPEKMLSLDELMPTPAEAGQLLSEFTAHPGENAEGALLQAERQALLQRALLTVPPAYRLLFVLHDMEELDTGQVAAILDLKPATVRVRLHRARLSVRRAYSLLLRGKADANKSAAQQKPAARSRECREIFANLSEYMDGRLQPATGKQMQAHMDCCPACVAFLEDLKRTIDRCRQLEERCRPKVMERLQQLLVQEYFRLGGSARLQ